MLYTPEMTHKLQLCLSLKDGLTGLSFMPPRHIPCHMHTARRNPFHKEISYTRPKWGSDFRVEWMTGVTHKRLEFAVGVEAL